MIGVLDYGIGNIGSILNMVKKAGAEGRAVHTAKELAACDRLILPGVGKFDAGMALLDQSGMRDALDAAVRNGAPLLGHLPGHANAGPPQRGRPRRRAGLHSL